MKTPFRVLAGGIASRSMEFLNRPMWAADLPMLARNEHAVALRAMVSRYTAACLPVMNGSFEYSNLREGPDQLLTCGPHRLWEYSSIFDVWQAKRSEAVLDVGGAASPLPYFLAERECDVTAIDLQPLLVHVCNDVAEKRKLSLRASVRDITQDNSDWEGRFGLVTCISVLEHVPSPVRSKAFQSIAKILKPEGLFYLTFDYGTYSEQTGYGMAGGELSTGISDLPGLCREIEAAGLRFYGNDPRQLPPEILALKASPGYEAFARRVSILYGVLDGASTWKSILGYTLRRIRGGRMARLPRIAQHNFFRMFLQRAG